MTIYILFGILGIAVIWFIAIYKGFVRLVNRVKEAWADIDVQLKRRYDLIPNLVETVKGYATHEREAFEKVTEARAGSFGSAIGKGKRRSRQSSQRSFEIYFCGGRSVSAVESGGKFRQSSKRAGRHGKQNSSGAKILQRKCS